MKKYKIVIAAVMVIAFASCEKVINVDLKNAEPKIVIEGIVDNSGNPAAVKISKSVSFSAGNTYPAVSGATVKITDGAGNSFTLTEGAAGTYSNALLKGVPGKTYNLSVTAEGKNYTATSIMPQQVPLDTLIQDTVRISGTVKVVNAIFSDPPGFGNNYHLVQIINGKRNASIFASDDLYTDGSATPFQLDDGDKKLKTGDVVLVEMQCIDYKVYRYIKGLSDLRDANTVPANPDTNISGNPLGYFSAHTSEKKTIVIR
jgi:hypothetical protein